MLVHNVSQDFHQHIPLYESRFDILELQHSSQCIV